MSSSGADPSQATVRVDMPAPKTLAAGRYVVRRVLGEGAQKTVYLADDTALERTCAVAVLRGDALNAEALVRARREAQAMARLGGQPNIVTVYDIGDDEGRPFIVSEYVEGGDLRAVLRDARGPLAVERALGIVADVASALAAAHARGVIHRDVKPANVWLASDGTAKLGDFGIASALDRSRITLSGSVMGTAAYMAPEQALGGDVDARSDLYALGAVFYELVTGRPPFLGDDALAVISQHINVAPVAPSWHNAALTAPVEDLVLRLLAKSPDDRPPGAAEVAHAARRLATGSPAPAAPAAPRPALRGLAWGRFVGRPREMERLKAAFDRAESGAGGIVMVTGEPGIGKTRLAEEFGVYARLRGAQVLQGRCYEGESIPYQPFIEAFRGYVRSRADPPLREELGTGAAEIAALVSEVRRRFPDVPETSIANTSDAQRARLFESIAQFLANAAGSSAVVLILDDLHWADAPTLLLLRHLPPRLGRERVLLVATYRDVELDARHPLADALAVLRREQNFERLALRGLGEDSVDDLIASVSESDGDPENRRALAAGLFRETDGNPFFIREILSHLVEERKLYRDGGHWVSDSTSLTDLGIPEGIRDVVGRRLGRLSERCHAMLTTLSAMPAGFSWDVLMAIGGEDETSLLDLLDEALEAHLIVERKDQRGLYEFTHALIRQTLYEELSTPRRMLLHRRIGEALEALFAGSLDAHATELAYHYYRAAPSGAGIEKAVAFGRRAARRAMAQYAHEDALLHVRRALELLDLGESPEPRLRAELLIDLGAALKRAAEMAEARKSYTQAADIALALQDADLLAEAALGFGSIPSEGGAVDQYLVRITQEALAHLPGDRPATRARLLACQARALEWAADTDRRIALTTEAVRLARASGATDALAYVLGQHRGVIAGPAFTGERLAISEEVAGLAARLGDPELELYAECWRVVDLLELGQLQELPSVVDVLTQKGARIKQPLFLWYRSVFEVTRALLEGRFADAEQETGQVLIRGQQVQPNLAMQVFGAQMLALRWMQGRLPEIEGVFRGLAAQYPGLPALQVPVAFMLVELGRDDEARDLFLALAADDFAALPHDSTWLMTMSLLAHVCVRLGETRHASGLYARMEPFANRNVVLGDALVSNGSCARYLGMLAGALGRWDDADRHFEEATRANRAMGAQPFVALGLCDQAATLLARGVEDGATRAAALLREAGELAAALGMAHLWERCREMESGVA